MNDSTPTPVAHDSRNTIARLLARPVGTLTLLAVLVALGVIAYSRIPIQLLPGGWGSQTFTIRVPYPDANPRETEERITRPLEEEIRTIPGVRRVRSSSGTEGAWIRVEFGGDQDLDVAYSELHDRLEKVRPRLPRGADRTFIFRFSPDESAPIFFGGLQFDLDPYDPRINDICENILKPRIEGLDGVAQLNVHGALEESIRILLDPEKVRAHRLDLVAVVQRLSRDNFASPVGKVEDGESKFLLRVDSRFHDLDEIRAVPVGAGLRIDDVADVRRVQAIRDTLTRINGQATLFCSISKASGANTVETCERVVAAMAELEKRPDTAGFRFNAWFNQGKMIRSSLKALEDAARDGGIWALAVLFFFLRRVRLTLLIALAIPVSLMATLVSLYFAGSSMNMVSMAGITLAIGSLVDNAVVVVENIHRKKELGVPLRQSVIEGAGEVAVALTLATLTSVVVFIPLIFMSAQRNTRIAMGALGHPFSVALLASLAAALVFIPVALFRLERAADSKLERRLARAKAVAAWPLTAPARAVGRLFRRRSASPAAAAHGAAELGEIERVTRGSLILRGLRWGNGKLLSWSLRHRFAAAVAAALAMATTFYAAEHVEQSHGDEDGSSLEIRVDLPTNTSLSQASEEFRVYEKIFLDHKAELGFADISVDFTRLNGDIDMWFDRPLPESRVEALRKRCAELLPKRASSYARVQGRRGREEGTGGVRYLIIGRDSEALADYAERAKELLETVPELTNVRTELERGLPEIRVKVDRDQSRRFDLNATRVSEAIEWGLRGYPLSRYQDDEVARQLVIQYEGAESSTLADLADLKVYSERGAELPLASVARFDIGKSYGMIFRRDSRTAIEVSADVLSGDAKKADAAARRALEPLIAMLPREVSFDESGGMRDFRRDQEEIFSGLWLSIALVFLVMAVMFESTVLPLSILLTIPFAFFGAYWTLFLTGTPIDPLGMLGLIVLVGVVVNHGVVLVDHINFLRVREGLPRGEAVIRGSQDRLRPVLMTSLTTIAGLIPMAIAEQNSDGISFKVLALVVCGGLATSTFFTLWVVPLAYTFFDDLSAALSRTFRRAFAPRRRRSEAAA